MISFISIYYLNLGAIAYYNYDLAINLIDPLNLNYFFINYNLNLIPNNLNFSENILFLDKNFWYGNFSENTLLNLYVFNILALNLQLFIFIKLFFFILYFIYLNFIWIYLYKSKFNKYIHIKNYINLPIINIFMNIFMNFMLMFGLIFKFFIALLKNLIWKIKLYSITRFIWMRWFEDDTLIATYWGTIDMKRSKKEPEAWIFKEKGSLIDYKFLSIMLFFYIKFLVIHSLIASTLRYIYLYIYLFIYMFIYLITRFFMLIFKHLFFNIIIYIYIYVYLMLWQILSRHVYTSTFMYIYKFSLYIRDFTVRFYWNLMNIFLWNLFIEPFRSKTWLTNIPGYQHRAEFVPGIINLKLYKFFPKFYVRKVFFNNFILFFYKLYIYIISLIYISTNFIIKKNGLFFKILFKPYIIGFYNYIYFKVDFIIIFILNLIIIISLYSLSKLLILFLCIVLILWFILKFKINIVYYFCNFLYLTFLFIGFIIFYLYDVIIFIVTFILKGLLNWNRFKYIFLIIFIYYNTIYVQEIISLYVNCIISCIQYTSGLFFNNYFYSDYYNNFMFESEKIYHYRKLLNKQVIINYSLYGYDRVLHKPWMYLNNRIIAVMKRWRRYGGYAWWNSTWYKCKPHMSSINYWRYEFNRLKIPFLYDNTLNTTDTYFHWGRFFYSFSDYYLMKGQWFHHHLIKPRLYHFPYLKKYNLFHMFHRRDLWERNNHFWLNSKLFSNLIVQQIASKSYLFEQEAYLNKINAGLVYNYYWAMLESEFDLSAVSSDYNDEEYIVQILMHLMIDEFSFFDIIAVTLDYYKYKIKYDFILYLYYLNDNLFVFPLYLTFALDEEASGLIFYFILCKNVFSNYINYLIYYFIVYIKFYFILFLNNLVFYIYFIFDYLNINEYIIKASNYLNINFISDLYANIFYFYLIINFSFNLTLIQEYVFIFFSLIDSLIKDIFINFRIMISLTLNLSTSTFIFDNKFNSIINLQSLVLSNIEDVYLSLIDKLVSKFRLNLFQFEEKYQDVYFIYEHFIFYEDWNYKLDMYKQKIIPEECRFTSSYILFLVSKFINTFTWFYTLLFIEFTALYDLELSCWAELDNMLFFGFGFLNLLLLIIFRLFFSDYKNQKFIWELTFNKGFGLYKNVDLNYNLDYVWYLFRKNVKMKDYDWADLATIEDEDQIKNYLKKDGNKNQNILNKTLTDLAIKVQKVNNIDYLNIIQKSLQSSVKMSLNLNKLMDLSKSCKSIIYNVIKNENSYNELSLLTLYNKSTDLLKLKNNYNYSFSLFFFIYIYIWNLNNNKSILLKNNYPINLKNIITSLNLVKTNIINKSVKLKIKKLTKTYCKKLTNTYFKKLKDNEANNLNKFSYKLYMVDNRFAFLSLNLTYLVPLFNRLIKHGSFFNPYLYEMQQLLKYSENEVDNNIAKVSSKIDPIFLCSTYKWFYHFINIDNHFFSGKGGSWMWFKNSTDYRLFFIDFNPIHDYGDDLINKSTEKVSRRVYNNYGDGSDIFLWGWSFFLIIYIVLTAQQDYVSAAARELWEFIYLFLNYLFFTPWNVISNFYDFILDYGFHVIPRRTNWLTNYTSLENFNKSIGDDDEPEEWNEESDEPFLAYKEIWYDIFPVYEFIPSTDFYISIDFLKNIIDRQGYTWYFNVRDILIFDLLKLITTLIVFRLLGINLLKKFNNFIFIRGLNSSKDAYWWNYLNQYKFKKFKNISFIKYILKYKKF